MRLPAWFGSIARRGSSGGGLAQTKGIAIACPVQPNRPPLSPIWAFGPNHPDSHSRRRSQAIRPFVRSLHVSAELVCVSLLARFSGNGHGYHSQGSPAGIGVAVIIMAVWARGSQEWLIRLSGRNRQQSNNPGRLPGIAFLVPTLRVLAEPPYVVVSGGVWAESGGVYRISGFKGNRHGCNTRATWGRISRRISNSAIQGVIPCAV